MDDADRAGFEETTQTVDPLPGSLLGTKDDIDRCLTGDFAHEVSPSFAKRAATNTDDCAVQTRTANIVPSDLERNAIHIFCNEAKRNVNFEASISYCAIHELPFQKCGKPRQPSEDAGKLAI